MNTRQKILDRALEMYNERGIEYVGLRELANDLNIRVSNITYYFPTKDDLVFELSQALSRRNNEVIVDNLEITMTGFLEMLRKVFDNHYEFRGLLRSFVHVMTQNKAVLASYEKIRKNRQATLGSNIQRLVTRGYLKVENDEKLHFLVSTLSLINRYWISEAAVFGRHLSKSEQIKQNLEMILALLDPYASAKGRREMMVFRQDLNSTSA